MRITQPIRWVGNIPWEGTIRLGTETVRWGTEETFRRGAKTVRWARNVPWTEPVSWVENLRQTEPVRWAESVRWVETIHWVELIRRLVETAFLLMRASGGNPSAFFSLLLNVLELYADLVEWRRGWSEEVAPAF